jgi:hypothetical protein
MQLGSQPPASIQNTKPDLECPLCRHSLALDDDGQCVHCGLSHNHELESRCWDEVLSKFPLLDPPVDTPIEDLFVRSGLPTRLMFLRRDAEELGTRHRAETILAWFEPYMPSEVDALCREILPIAQRARDTKSNSEFGSESYPAEWLPCSPDELHSWARRLPRSWRLDSAVKVYVNEYMQRILQPLKSKSYSEKSDTVENWHVAPDIELFEEFIAHHDPTIITRIVESSRNYERTETRAFAELMRVLGTTGLVRFWRHPGASHLRDYVKIKEFDERAREGWSYRLVYHAMCLHFSNLFRSVVRRRLRSARWPISFTKATHDDSILSAQPVEKQKWTQETIVEAIRYAAQFYGTKFYGMAGSTDLRKLAPISRRLPTPVEMKTMFGSVFAGLVYAGVIEGRIGTYGYRCLARDGHECHSMAESIVDDAMAELGIRHEREPIYPFDAELNPHGSRADWLVYGCFVELFGLLGREEYDAKVGRKRLLARKFGFTLIEITPSDVLDSARLVRLLRQIPRSNRLMK